jgi:hypothetical protein
MSRHFLALASVILVAAGCAAASERSGTQSGSPTEAASPTTEGHARFVPPTHSDDGSVVMPVTFPDGTTAELVYPPELDLSSLRVQPYSSGYGPGFGRDFLVYDESIGEVIGSYEGAELLREYDNGHGGTVGFWRLPPDGVYLAFQFGSWTVLVYDYTGDAAMSDEDRRLWAANFHGQDAEDGFLVLWADSPLALAGVGEHAGPELEFWSPAGELRGVLLFPGKCTPYHEGEGGFDDIEMVNGLAVSRDDEFADWCVPKASMTVHVYQERGDTFIDDVLDGLEIRNVELAT